MRAPLRRQVKLIGEKWLRNEFEEDSRKSDSDGTGSWRQGNKFAPQNTQPNRFGENLAQDNQGKHMQDAIKGISNQVVNTDKVSTKGIKILENKKRRTDTGVGQENSMGLNTEFEEVSEEDEPMNVEEYNKSCPKEIMDPKNVKEAGPAGALLVL